MAGTIFSFPPPANRFTPGDLALMGRWADAAAPLGWFAEIDAAAGDEGADILMLSFGHATAPIEYFLIRRGGHWKVENLSGLVRSHPTLLAALQSIQDVAGLPERGGRFAVPALPRGRRGDLQPLVREGPSRPRGSRQGRPDSR